MRAHVAHALMYGLCTSALKGPSAACFARRCTALVQAAACCLQLCHITRFVMALLTKHVCEQARVGVVKRSKQLKTHTPTLIATGCPAIAAKLKKDCDWSEKDTVSANYRHSAFAFDPNAALRTASQQTVTPEGALHVAYNACILLQCCALLLLLSWVRTGTVTQLAIARGCTECPK